VEHIDAIKAKGVDEVWCVAVNDAFVMGAWGREQGAEGKVRMLGDGSATWTQAMGLTLDLTARNMGVRSQRYAAIIDDGVITTLAVEEPGAFEASSAEAMIKHL
jgi:peroxiredoxin